MNNKFFKVGKDQESNLKWLLNRIFYNAQCGRNSYIITSSVLNYADIFEAYEQYYHKTCPASIFSDLVELKEEDILCVHDLLGNFHFNILDVIKENEDKCKYIYITMLGHKADYDEFEDNDVEQIKMDIPDDCVLGGCKKDMLNFFEVLDGMVGKK